MIKNIVFDMGNVLLKYHPKEFIQKYVADEEVQQLLFDEIFASVEWLQFDRGTITRKGIQKAVQKRIPEELGSVVEQILTDWYQDLQPIEEMADVIIKLKKKGYALYILSNASQVFYQFKDKIPNFSAFDGVFISSDWQLLKPEKEIYSAFYSHFQLIPSQCYFIDDSPPNIESAKTTGMDGVIFRGNVVTLIEQLEKLAIL